MKVLSDWQSGNPSSVGNWLTRLSQHDGIPVLAHWDGKEWSWIDDFEGSTHPYHDGQMQWCGLAFDPNAVEWGVLRNDITGKRTEALIIHVKDL